MNGKDGFWGYIVTGADLNLGVDGLRGMFDVRLKQLFDDVGGLFVGWQGTLNQDGKDDATAYADGFFDTLDKRFGTNGGTAPPVGTPPPPPISGKSIGSIVGFSVPANQLGGAHTTSIGNITINLPHGMTNLPSTPTGWLPYIGSLETAIKMHDKFG
jgi:hypothetical protein